jgi:transposase
MRKIKEVLRLHHACRLGKRKIAPLVGIGPTAVGDYLRRAREAGLDWPLPDDVDDEALERRLFPPPPSPIAETRPVPDWSIIACELRRKGVTLRLGWEEYRGQHPDGFGYSWFCDMYRAWQGRL